jgi:hypothetical protein
VFDEASNGVTLAGARFSREENAGTGFEGCCLQRALPWERKLKLFPDLKELRVRLECHLEIIEHRDNPEMQDKMPDPLGAALLSAIDLLKILEGGSWKTVQEGLKAWEGRSYTGRPGPKAGRGGGGKLSSMNKKTLTAIIGLTLALWVSAPAIAQTGSGLPPAPMPEEVKPDGQGASSPDKRFWINPEDERRKAENKPAPTPAPAPPTPETKLAEEIQKLSKRLEMVEEKVFQLETAHEPVAAAPSPQPQRRQKAQQVPPQQRPRMCRTPDGDVVPCQLLRIPRGMFDW